MMATAAKRFSRLLDPLRQRYGPEMPFLREMLHDAAATKPYAGLRILHNVPLFRNTLLKIEPLVTGGAEVIMTNPSFVRPDAAAVAFLTAAGIHWETDHNKISGRFDYVLDTGAEFQGRVAAKGAVELTKAGERRYVGREVPYPVVSVDRSRLKQLETCLGTGDGLLRALQQLLGSEFHGKDFVIFGFGKVGRGAARSLRGPAGRITIVDVDQNALTEARRRGYAAIHGGSTVAVSAAVQNAYAIVTASGVPGLITEHYHPDDFQGKVLANLGADDEFGAAFTEGQVLNGKQPVNFCLADPTAMRYIDPVFYAHNYGINLLQAGDFSPGLHAYPEEIDRVVVSRWQQQFGESVEECLP
ncbi:MAG: NAD-binding protein [Candidatus Aenigmarchaeota archaeon]|nr:NAD-binding protein [Candidatus Aenigmarchaeota archaeon]